MAWSTPVAWTLGDSITAAKMNAMQDNITYLGSPPQGMLTITTSSAISSNASETYPDPGGVIALDTLSMSSSTTRSTYRLVAGEAGTWLVSAQVTWPATASATGSSLRSCVLYVNGSPSLLKDVQPNVLNVVTICKLVEFPVSLSAGGYVDVRGWQNSGSSQTPVAGGCFLFARKITQ